MPTGSDTPDSRSHFIRNIIEADLADGTHETVVTRFPPEPNGFLHIGHAKSICLNFGMARDYQGRCHLRFDDTNPTTEDERYVASIQRDVQWLGFDWGDHLYHASDYFERLYAFAEQLIAQGDAYVDSQDGEAIRDNRGTVTEPGTPSPYRSRSPEENLTLFREMRAGAYGNGAHVLRAKIDMASPHMIMRDPILYRIRHTDHYRTGGAWCIYPMYDFAHCLSDAIEEITHSLCTLEFENNRRLYDWILERCLPAEQQATRPHQYEFARLNMDYTVMSKRKLLRLVEEGLVDGWDDPRLPTLAGLRRRGVPPSAIRTFCDRIGVAKANSRVEIALFEHVLRDDLNYRSPRIMGVLDPLKVTITNYPAGETEQIEAPHWPRDIDNDGSRTVPFGRELYIEREDFRMDPPDGFYRLAPGREVRLRHAYFLRCDDVVRDGDGEVVELRCTYDPDTKGQTKARDGRRPKGIVHWVSAAHAVPATVRMVDRLFSVPNPEAHEEDFTAFLNPHSMPIAKAMLEPAVRDFPAEQRLQFERQGYFWRDADATDEALVFNQIIPLRDSWSAEEETADAPTGPTKEEIEAANPQIHTDPAAAFTDAQNARLQAFTEEFGVARDDAVQLIDTPHLADYLEAALDGYHEAQAVANWILNELMGMVSPTELPDLPFTPEQFGVLVRQVDTDEITGRVGKDVLAAMLERGVDPQDYIAAEGLHNIDDEDALREIIDAQLSAYPGKVEAYRNGKEGLLGFFMGHVMRETNGQADPQTAQALLRNALTADTSTAAQ
ncbi:MAG: glutamine--tRNA ligase/YqeY domain fusion protein [Bacteroidetes bacterium]|jgi:glutaminyl-tRNA synthetase|nr:glutamine--tRNA ligase/YqeY domain fusion protein [Bacteroidota bacterium]